MGGRAAEKRAEKYVETTGGTVTGRMCGSSFRMREMKEEARLLVTERGRAKKETEDATRSWKNVGSEVK